MNPPASSWGSKIKNLLRNDNKVVFLLVLILVVVVGLIFAKVNSPKLVLLSHPSGTLVRLPNSQDFYLVQDNKLLPVSQAVMQSRGYTSADVVQASGGDMGMKKGDPLPLREGMFFKDGSKTYLVGQTNGNYVKRPVPNTKVIEQLGYSSSEVWGNEKNSEPKQNGPAFTSAATHPDGTLIAGGGKLYVINNQQRQPVTSSAVLQSWGLTNWPPKFATAGDMKLPQGPNLPYREGTLVKSANDYFIIENQGNKVVKDNISGSYTMPNLGYSPKRALVAGPRDLPAANGKLLTATGKTEVIMEVVVKKGQDGRQLSKSYVSKYNGKLRFAFKNWFSLSVPANTLPSIKGDYRIATTGAVAQVQSVCAEAALCGGGTIPPAGSVPPSPPPAPPAPAPAPPPYSSSGSQQRAGEGTGGALNTPSPTPSPAPAPAPAPPPPTNVAPPGLGEDPRPTVTGQAIVGSTLTVSSNGLWSNNPTGFSYQWRQCGINCTNIVGATNSTYTITANMVGYSIQVAVTASNRGGANVAYDSGSPPVGAVGIQPPAQNPAPAPAPNVPPPPTNVAPKGLGEDPRPTTSGAAIVGSTLRVASNGLWTNSPTSYKYQWLACGLSCSNIPGATGSTYTITPDKAGYSIQLAVTATNAGGSNVAYSPGTLKVATAPSKAPGSTVAPPQITPPNKIPRDDALPAISGVDQVGQTLRVASNGIWSGTPTFKYQWWQCALKCTAISGATGSTYFITADKVGYGIQLAVTATNAGGSTTAFSADNGVVTPQPLPPSANPAPTGPPVNIKKPIIAGTAVVGSTLFVSSGSWTQAVSSYSYQWQWCFPGPGPFPEDGIACYDIDGATSSTYTITNNYVVGKQLHVKVTARNSKGSGAAVSSLTKVVPAPGTDAAGKTQPTQNGPPLIQQSPPVVTGAPYVNSILSTTNGKWVNAVKYTYQWQRCPAQNLSACKNIAGQTNQSYTVVQADLNSQIRVDVLAIEAPWQGLTLEEDAYSNAILIKSYPANTPPAVSLTANPPENAPFGSTVQLTWTSEGADPTYQDPNNPNANTPCVASGGWTNKSLPYKGTGPSNNPIQATTTYVITCSNKYGTSPPASATVSIIPPTCGDPNLFLPLCRIGWRPTASSSNGSTVAVLDTGVDKLGGITYASGTSAASKSCNTSDPTPSTTDDVGHGTSVASVIGGNMGVAPGTPILPVRLNDSTGQVDSTDFLACGIQTAVDQNASVINISSGPFTDSDTALSNALQAAAAKKIAIVISAGNYGYNATSPPTTSGYVLATYPYISVVGGMSDSDMKPGGLGKPGDLSTETKNACKGADDVGWGTAIDDSQRAVGVAAPSCNVVLSKDNGLLGWGQGTSFSAPVISALDAKCKCAVRGDSDPAYGFKSNADDKTGYGKPFYGYLVHWQ